MTEEAPKSGRNNSPAYESGRRIVRALQFTRLVADVPTTRRSFLVTLFIDPLRRARGIEPGPQDNGRKNHPNHGGK